LAENRHFSYPFLTPGKTIANVGLLALFIFSQPSQIPILSCDATVNRFCEKSHVCSQPWA